MWHYYFLFLVPPSLWFQVFDVIVFIFKKSRTVALVFLSLEQPQPRALFVWDVLEPLAIPECSRSFPPHLLSLSQGFTLDYLVTPSRGLVRGVGGGRG